MAHSCDYRLDVVKRLLATFRAARLVDVVGPAALNASHSALTHRALESAIAYSRLAA